MAANALNVTWTYGFRKDVIEGVHSLTTEDRNALFYISSHSGVIYNFEHRTQMILQGHCNLISCCAVSRDKRWIVTGDIGDDPILVVWDSSTGAPVKTVFSPHPKGTVSLDVSDDCLFIASLGASDVDTPQDLAVWAWTNEEDSPILRQHIASEKQHTVKFDTKNKEFLSTTGQQSVCFWTWREFSLEGYAAKVSKSDFGFFSGNFTSTIFLAGTSNALTSTTDGYVIFWESQSSHGTAAKSKHVRNASKVLRLVECGIQSMVTTENNYLAVACSDGAIRFYDFFLRLEAWFEDLCAGSISSVSFGVQRCPFPDTEAGTPGLRFWVPDFIVGTADAFIVGVESTVFDCVRPEERRGTLLMQGVADEVTCITTHPFKPLIALACMNGTIQIWDYEMKLLMNLREFNAPPASTGPGQSKPAFEPKQLKPLSVAYEPHADLIAVGFSSGSVRFLNSNTYEDMCTYIPSSEPILVLKFSPSGLFLSGYDKSNHVMLFKRDLPPDEQQPVAGGNVTFTYTGRIRSHSRPICGLEFGYREGLEVLVSVGEDRFCVEYDLEASTVASGMVCITLDGNQYGGRTIEQTAKPTAAMWHPHVDGDVEDRFVVANDEFKFKEFNVDSKQCRKTTLAPTFGGPLTSTLQLPRNGRTDYYVYSTASKVIGIGCFPLTGNPSKMMGLVAHPAAISSIAVSYDGAYMFSAGGSDLSVNMWIIDPTALPSPSSGEEDVADFLCLLEGGEGAELHNDIVDYFYYCQIRSQGEQSMESRDISGLIPLDEISALMRAIGYYPSEEEVSDMVNEVRYKTFLNTGETMESIGLHDLIKLYINHRPVLPLNNKAIADAFAMLAKSLGKSTDGADAALTWLELKRVLMSEGEPIGASEMETFFMALIGSDTSVVDDDLKMSGKVYASEVLGFESVDSA